MKKNIYEKEVHLTEREHEILKLIVKGYSNPEIAKKIFISESTAKAHVSNILSKLGISGRVELAVYAIKNNLV